VRLPPWLKRPLVAELLLLVLGVALRVSMALRYDARWGYDWWWHWQYISWMADHGSLPSPDQSLEYFHPPLYYFLAGRLVRLGAGVQAVSWLSVGAGCLRLGLVAWGLRRWVPDVPARLLALALAAVLPASVFLDGMESGEALANLLCAGAILAGAAAFERAGRARLGPAALFGVLVGLALLTKVSAVTLLAAAVLATAFEIAWATGDRARRAAPLLVALALVGATSGWYLARNYQLKQKLLLSSFDGYERKRGATVAAVPYLLRREPDFLHGWSLDVHRDPHHPSATRPAYFWPLLLASTFVDYYNFGFKPHPDPRREPSRYVNSMSQPRGELWPARLSFHGGLVIALATVAAFCVAARAALRRRLPAWLFLLAVPLFAIVAQLHFAWQYPFDKLGVVKGVYVQYAAPPLCALFGLAVAWLWRRPLGRIFAAMALGGLGLVAAYSVYCRLL
jgi:hypothetical protein